MTFAKIMNLRQKLNLWLGDGEQMWPKLDYLTLQSEDKQLNLKVLAYQTARCNKMWIFFLIAALLRLTVQLVIYFTSSKQENFHKF